MISPRWDWVFEDETGQVTPVALSPAFTTRFDAEEWLGGAWRTVAARGIAVAVLRNDGEHVDQVDLRAGEARQEG